MKYIDTNVLVRIITGDIPSQATKAINEIQAGGRDEYSMLDAILVELCFVLEFHEYKMKRTDIVDALGILFATPQVFVSDTSLATLKIYKKYPKLDYADCLLFVMGGKDGVLTFDNGLQKILLK